METEGTLEDYVYRLSVRSNITEDKSFSFLGLNECLLGVSRDG